MQISMLANSDRLFCSLHKSKILTILKRKDIREEFL